MFPTPTKIVSYVSADYRYNNCKGKPQGVCGQTRVNERRIQNADAAFVLETRTPGIRHYHDGTGIPQRPINLLPWRPVMLSLMLKIIPPAIVILNAIIDYFKRR